jgi:hypothetical protein
VVARISRKAIRARNNRDLTVFTGARNIFAISS